MLSIGTPQKIRRYANDFANNVLRATQDGTVREADALNRLPQNIDPPDIFEGLLNNSITGIVLRNLVDINPLLIGPTPERYATSGEESLNRVDLIQIAAASLLGAPYGIHHIRGGRVVSDIYPRPGFCSKPDSAFGSNELFDFHADGGAFPMTRPDFFMLLCLRNTEKATTMLTDVKSIDPELAGVLSNDFEVRYTPNDHRPLITPIVTMAGGKITRINYYGRRKARPLESRTEAEKKSHQAALDQLERYLVDNHEAVALGPGEALFAGNNTVVHGRHQFEAAPQQGARRWIKRVVIARRANLLKIINPTTHIATDPDYTTRST